MRTALICPQKTVYGANVIVFEGILAFANKELLKVLLPDAAGGPSRCVAWEEACGGVEGEAAAPALTQRSGGRTRTRDLDCSRRVPSRRQPHGAAGCPRSTPRSHARSLSGASSPLWLDSGFPEAESPIRRTPDEFVEWYTGENSSRRVPPERDPQQRDPWAIVPLQFTFPSPQETVRTNSSIRVWALPVLHRALSLSLGGPMLLLSLRL